MSDAELDNLVAARMARQAVLAHLLSAAEQPHVALRVAPLSAGAHAGLPGPFVILEFAEEPALIFVVNQTSGLVLEEEPGMPALDLSGTRWRKSSRSSDIANCVKVAFAGPVVAPRDSKNPAGTASQPARRDS